MFLCRIVVFMFLLNLCVAQNCIFSGDGCDVRIPFEKSCRLLKRLASDRSSSSQAVVAARPRNTGDKGITDFEDRLLSDDADPDIYKEFSNHIQQQDDIVYNSLKQHMTSRSEQVSRLSAKHQQLKTKHKNVLSQHEKSMKEISNRLATAVQEVQACTKSKHALNNEITNLEEQIAESEELTKSLREELTEKLTEINNLSSQNQQCASDRSALIDQVSQFEIQVSELTSMNEAKDKTLTQLDYQLQDRIAELQASYDRMLEQEALFDVERQEHAEAIVNMSDAMQLLRDVLVKREAKISGFVNRIRKMEQVSRRTESRLKSYFAQITQMRQQRDSVQSEKLNLQNAVKDMTYQTKSMERSLYSRSRDLQKCLRSNSVGYCDLELSDSNNNQTCWFQRKREEDMDWVVASNHQLNGQEGPILDHTCKSKSGHYLYLPMSSTGQTSILTSLPFFKRDGPQCFTFWYSTKYGYSGTGALRVIALLTNDRTGVRDTSFIVWNAGSESQQEWTKAYFQVPPSVTSKGYQLQFVALSGGHGYAAIDDITVTDGPCRP